MHRFYQFIMPSHYTIYKKQLKIMHIDEIKAIAGLARLDFSKDELNTMKDTLTEIFRLVDQIEQIDTEGVPALASPLETVARMRGDEVTEKDQSESLHKVAPEVNKQLYLVPKVID